jgi:hypothetical protein
LNSVIDQSLNVVDIGPTIVHLFIFDVQPSVPSFDDSIVIQNGHYLELASAVMLLVVR